MKMRQQKPCFFKVMIDDFKQKLEIPEAFVKNISDKSSEIAILENPSGVQWRVRVRRSSDGRVHMEDGWGCFSSENSLSFGEFVLFRYKGHMHFSVEIYGTDTLEREDAVAVTYPPEMPKLGGVKRRGRPPKVQKGFQFQIAKRRGRPPKVQQGTKLQGIKPRGRPPKLWDPYYGPIKNTLKPRELAMFFQNAEITRQACVTEPRKRHGIPLKAVKLKHYGPIKNEEDVLENRILESKELRVPDQADSHKGLGHEASYRRLEVAPQGFTSDLPHFVVKLKAYTLKFPFQMCLPISFGRAIFPGDKTNITLTTPAGENWPVKVYKTGLGAYRFTSGWEKFALDNSLMQGDICVFELVAKLEMQVHIFPAEQT